MIHLVLGGARSGKSRFAEQIAKDYRSQVVYVATATAGDDEMQQRIEFHKKSRPQNWLLIEEPLELAQRLRELDQPCTILIDCMTLWLNNWLCHHELEDWLKQKEAFVNALLAQENTVVIVSNEVGSGIVPMGELSREFVDQCGWLNQTLALVANRVTLVVAGIPMTLKSYTPSSFDSNKIP